VATFTLEVVPFLPYAPLIALLPFLECVLEVVFCEGVSAACDSASITSIVKMEVFQFYLQSGKQRKIGWVGDDRHVAFGQKFPGEKKCETVRCRDATTSSFVAKVQNEVFATSSRNCRKTPQ
jgi:hypothetical protein